MLKLEIQDFDQTTDTTVCLFIILEVTMNPSDVSNGEREGQKNMKRKIDESGESEDVEMSFEPTQEDVRMIVAAGNGNLEEIKTLNDEGNADICFQVSYRFVFNFLRYV